MAIEKGGYASKEDLATVIRVARGQEPCDLVLRGGRWLDVFSGTFAEGDVAIHQGFVVATEGTYAAKSYVELGGDLIVPGFIDAHVHLESSLMTPGRFQQVVLPAGTTSVIWDPHEIANVKGADGIEWAYQATEGLWLDVFLMIPSCVPSTSPELRLETSGAVLRAHDISHFTSRPRVLGLAEMMNFPGLLAGDPDVLSKLEVFKNQRRDGHCPGLKGMDLNAYAAAGIHSCHESTTRAEALEKLRKGIHVLVREGSCAKDADELLPLLDAFTSACVGFCSDDRNPADIAHEGHISVIVEKALKRGIAPAAVFRAASYAAARMYGLGDRGAIAPGYLADLVVCSPKNARPGSGMVSGSWESGLAIKCVFKKGLAVQELNLAAAGSARPAPFPGKNLHLAPVLPNSFRMATTRPDGRAKVRVIGVIPRQILTHDLRCHVEVRGGELRASPLDDILKITVLERHKGLGSHATGFVQGFGLKRGAIATSINHDAHNVITVGADDEAMALAVNELRKIDGGIVVVGGDGLCLSLPLPIAGLMTDQDPGDVTGRLVALKALTRELGCALEEPFLQLSFLALPVIPSLKISDQGLVDVERGVLVAIDG